MQPAVLPAEPAFVRALRSPLAYDHPAGRVEMLETHISWVFLAGDYAYKVKKPVDLGFLDFSTLERRRRCCEDEVRLNRRTAPGLYLGVVPIGGSESAPVVGNGGEPFEYAVRMRRFPQSARLDVVAREGRLAPAHVDALAASIARFHASAKRQEGEAPPPLLALALDNLRALRAQAMPAIAPAQLAALEEWTLGEHRAVAATLERRRREGFVRECHGDLHLANVVLLDGEPVPFDCIEFSEILRCTDVMGDVAFIAMDLRRHGLGRLAARFVDAYLSHTGDYDGLAVLRLHAVYRALVRAKVAGIRAVQPGGLAAAEEAAAHVALALALAAPVAASLTILHGLSGSGKTTVSQRLLEEGGAVRLRSDVERKRMHGLAPASRAGEASVGTGLYAQDERDRTYARLESLAAAAIAAGYPVIVDAAFLERAQRDRFRALARATGAAFSIVCCAAPEAVLRERVAARAAAGSDASDAGIAVLEAQLAAFQPLDIGEMADARVIDTTKEVP